MGQSNKKKKQRRKEQRRESSKSDLPDQHVLDSIGSPNAWTPKTEDAWLEELHKINAGEIYRRFPPMRKPPNVGRRGKNYGWGSPNA